MTYIDNLDSIFTLNTADGTVTNTIAKASVDPTSTITGVDVGDWATLGWIVVILLLINLGIPTVMRLRGMIAKDETADFRKSMASYMSDTATILKSLKTEIGELKAPGALDKVDAVRIVHTYLDKAHLDIMVFLAKALKDPESKTLSSDKLSNRYRIYAGDIAGRATGYLKHFTLDGKSLGDFFSVPESSKYYLNIMSELYALHALEIIDPEKEKISLWDVHDGLDRCLSQLLSMFECYTSTGNTFMEQWDGSDPKFVIIKPMSPITGAVEEL